MEVGPPSKIIVPSSTLKPGTNDPVAPPGVPFAIVLVSGLLKTKVPEPTFASGAFPVGAVIGPPLVMPPEPTLMKCMFVPKTLFVPAIWPSTMPALITCGTPELLVIFPRLVKVLPAM